MTAFRVLVAPFGPVGETSSGSITLKRGDLEWPDDVTRVKLLVEHDRSGPVGYASEILSTDLGVVGVFQLPGRSKPVLDAVGGIRNKLRDGVSPGVDWTQDTLVRLKRAGARTPVKAAGLLREVSLVAVGGFVDARVLEEVDAA